MQRQLTIKILTIVTIALAILLSVNMVTSKIDERERHVEQAKKSISQSWTGPQSFITPVLIIPYRAPKIQKDNNNKNHVVWVDRQRVILPNRVTGNISVANKNVSKGIYQVPVYNSQIQLSGEFLASRLNDVMDSLWNETHGEPPLDYIGTPYLSFQINDVRGLDATPLLHINEQAFVMQPGSRLGSLGSGLSVDLPDVKKSQSSLNFTMNVSLRGMNRLLFFPASDEVSMTMTSDWPHPQFSGASLPLDRDISDEGFSATWQSTQYSNNGIPLLRTCVASKQCKKLHQFTSGVTFIEPVDIYLQSERTIKYAMLFIGLSFITFFIFEHVKQVRIHPIQYTFVGLAIAVFYLLLISLAEHVAFHWAYLLGATACSLLLLFYVRYILQALSSAMLFFSMIVSLYSVLYVIVQAEDFALLMGSVFVFLVLVALMIVTRNIDWYGLPTTHNASLAIKSESALVSDVEP